MLRVGFEPTPFWTRTLIWCLIQRSIIPSRIQRSINLPFSSRSPSLGWCPQSLPLLAGALNELPLLTDSLSLSLSWCPPRALSNLAASELSPCSLHKLSPWARVSLKGHESPWKGASVFWARWTEMTWFIHSLNIGRVRGIEIEDANHFNFSFSKLE